MWTISPKICTALLLLSAQIASVVSGTPTPSTTCPSTAGSAPNVFGVASSASSSTTATTTTSSDPAASRSMAPPTLELRGGVLFEPETVEEVEAIVTNAENEGKLVVIDFTASWCGPCKMIAPLFKEMSEEIADVVFVKVDVDENPETAAKYSVSAMPTFVFVKGGEVVDRLMGANAARLRELIEEHD